MTDDSPPRWMDYVRVRDLMPHPENPKGHVEDLIRDSVQRFGFTSWPEIDERTGLLAAGHGRLKVLSALEAVGERPDFWPDGRAWPPDGIVVDEEGAWQVPTQRGWASRDDAEAKAYLVAANRTTEQGGWENQPLADILSGLSDTDDGFLGVGYDQNDLDDLLSSLTPPDLDALAEKLGEPDDRDFWPVLRFKVPIAVRDRFSKLVGHVPEDDRFVKLLDLAEAGSAD